ncbi:MAG: restriction endonuclease subunit S [Mameliella sp.]|nr:restriction endonuclease subunit S [Phaeodactylibacter sp.]
MRKYKPYSEYKESGSIALGEIPVSWEVKKLAYTFTQANAGEVIDKTFWGDGGEVLYTCNRTPLKSDFSNFPKVKRTSNNDLLLTRNGTPYVHKPLPNSIYSNVVQRISLKPGLNRDFLAYCLGNSALSLRGYGVSIESLNFENWKSLQFVVPSPEDQKKIVKFLDYETVKIDTLVDKQKQLIRLLTEKREAVISRTVLGELNSEKRLKYSGTKWLGYVPTHWTVAPLKSLVEEKVAGPYGASLTKDMYTTSGIKVYGQQHVISDDFESGNYFISEKKYQSMTRYKVYPSDVLISVMGTVGKVAVVPESAAPGIINPRLVRYKFDSTKIYPEFIKVLILSKRYQAHLSEASQGSTMEGLNMGILGRLPLAFPSIDEQRILVNYINEVGQTYSQLIGNAEKFIALASERRTALIYSAVTGKIDVRNWKPTDNQNTEEVEVTA